MLRQLIVLSQFEFLLHRNNREIFQELLLESLDHQSFEQK